MLSPAHKRPHLDTKNILKNQIVFERRPAMRNKLEFTSEEQRNLTWLYSAEKIISVIYSSNQIKSLLLSHHHSTSALVSEILESVLQTVQKNKTIYI